MTPAVPVYALIQSGARPAMYIWLSSALARGGISQCFGPVIWLNCAGIKQAPRRAGTACVSAPGSARQSTATPMRPNSVSNTAMLFPWPNVSDSWLCSSGRSESKRCIFRYFAKRASCGRTHSRYYTCGRPRPPVYSRRRASRTPSPSATFSRRYPRRRVRQTF